MSYFNSISRINNPLQEFIDSPDPIYGTGFHGDAVLDGTIVSLADGTTLIPDIANSFYSATTDLYFNNLTISTGIQLHPDGYRIFVKNLLTMGNNSRIGYTEGFSSPGSIAQGGVLGDEFSLANSLGGSSNVATANPPLNVVGGTEYYKVPHQAIRGWAPNPTYGTLEFLRGGASSTTGAGGGVVILTARYISVAPGAAYISAPAISNAGGGVVIVVSTYNQLPAAITTDVSGYSHGTVNYMQVI